jgi:hypothetical protein
MRHGGLMGGKAPLVNRLWPPPVANVMSAANILLEIQNFSRQPERQVPRFLQTHIA